ncbi:MAG: TetR/AcrR family transcriptional regulator [Lachnospiraceae bacterium]|nr:TetR/AcrR family transcriptional regulator [Lachnospiraceae bacterium]
MARPDRSLDPRILESARNEFLTMGFEKASLKAICDGAGVTTGALYKRYAGKEELFQAVVADTVEALERVLREKSVTDFSDVTDAALVKAWDMDEAYMMWWFRFLFERYDGFVLLLKCAEGTRYSNFQHDWVEKMTQSTYRYYREACRRGLCTADISEGEMHILLTAFWATIYEPFIHDYRMEQLEDHCKLVCRLFDWFSTLGFSEEAVHHVII